MLKINTNPRQSMNVIFALIAANVLIYLFISTTSQLYEDMAFIPNAILNGEIWRLITYSFLHGNFGHILFNMWGLYLFGTFVSPFLKPHQILNLYFISAIGGGLVQLAISTAPMVGASGAVCGFTAAAAMLAPNAKIMLLFFPAPLRMKTFFWVFIVMEFVLNYRDDLIAHMAHIGGVIGGFIYLLIIQNYQWNPLNIIFTKTTNLSNPYKNPDSENSYKSAESEPRFDKKEPVTQRELDHLLDKISAQGINSLTPDEYDRLRRAREAFKKQ